MQNASIESNIIECKNYALEKCEIEEPAFLKNEKPLKLAIIAGYSVTGYVKLGYDWLASYYNPLLMFNEVHYLQYSPVEIDKIDFGYPLYVHEYKETEDVLKICKRCDIDIIRAYDPHCGKIAYEIAEKLNIPVIVSIH